MKLIDRYLLRTLLTPLLYCLMAFVLLFVLFDLFNSLSDFVEGETPLRQIATYYALLMPSALIYIVPVSMLLSVLYSLSQLTRHNELTAMRASGMGLFRLMMPLVAVGILASLLVAVVHESVAPKASYWCYLFLRSQGQDEGDPSPYLAENLAMKNLRTGRIWMIQRFDTRTHTMERVEVIQQRPDGSDESRTYASKGYWLDGRWWFTDLTTQEFSPEGHPLGPPRDEARREMTSFTETPRDLMHEIKESQFLSSREIVTYLAAREHISSDAEARLRVDMHHRLAMPWATLVVTLLGIPFGNQTGRKGAVAGVILSLSMFFGMYIAINLGLVLGKEEILAPWQAAWAPLWIFFVGGLALIHRMR